VIFGTENIYAAEIYIEPNSITVSKSEEFKLDVMLDGEKGRT
jgi:hypothetical protein